MSSYNYNNWVIITCISNHTYPLKRQILELKAHVHVPMLAFLLKCNGLYGHEVNTKSRCVCVREHVHHPIHRLLGH